ncbi:carbohydrate binding domain-containing protein [Bacillus sp. TL12]|uniref:OmpL47-type beta-barrel domain-containing protein n=1 Tax=Bacillus sp. TL12 TaxID=2894756 RepID=UPI0032206781
MKKLFKKFGIGVFSTAIVLSASIGFSGIVSADSPSLKEKEKSYILNMDFEHNSSIEPLKPWPYGDIKYNIEDHAGVNNSKGLHLKASYGGGLVGTITLKPNTTYILSTSGKVNTPSSEVWVSVNVNGRGIASLGFNSSQYEQKSFEFTTPNSINSSEFYIYHLAGFNFDVNLDDIVLVENIKLDDTISPVTTDNAPTDWVNKDVTVNLTATDNDGGSGVASTYYQLDNGSTQSGNEIKISDEGVHTLTYWSVDNAGNTEQFHTKTIKLDKTAPVLNISLDKTTIWPPNHKMVPITATINASDDTSGINSVVLTSITSNETLQSDDIQNANYNKPISGSTDSFELRADRLGSGNGRIYTVTYTAMDNTGNVTTKTVTVTVPHDQSKKIK